MPSQQPQIVTHAYRPELDGLRALAIIPVILFHIHPDWLPGGFLGVDVFFVLSGFLITSTILPRMSDGHSGFAFSFRDFYLRRAKRLLPAILALILVLQLAGSLVLFNSEWRSQSEQAGALIGIFSNIFFWRQAADYWGAAAETMPLLHAWSLSVEEQFYLIYPVLLYFALRYKSKRNLPFWITLIVALLSFAGFIYARRYFPAAGFYWGIFRVWELLAGCLIAIFRHSNPRAEWPRRNSSRWLPLIGVGLIIAGYWSGWGLGVIGYRNAFMTVLGACLIIVYTDRTSWFVWSLFTLRPMIGIGIISYSLYLWHWPVIVFTRFAGIESLVIQLSASFVLAYVSYRWVEKPLRFCDNGRFFRGAGILLAATLLSLLLPFIVNRPGIKYTPPEFSSSINLEPANPSPRYGTFVGSFQTGLPLFNPKEGTADVVVIGDSHSLMFFPAICESCEALGLHLVFFGADGGSSPFFMEEGAPVSDYSAGGWKMGERRIFDQARIDLIKQNKPRLVVVCARWSMYHSWAEDRFLEHLQRIREICGGSQLVFVGQPPELPFGSDGFSSGTLDSPVFRTFREFSYATEFRRDVHDRIRRFCSATSNSHFVETEQNYFRAGGIVFREGQTLFYKDDDHLSIAGAMRSKHTIDDVLLRLK